MSLLVCGSLAFDTLLAFEDRFADHLLPDHLAKLSAAFRVPVMRREWGGCAGNIAYTLGLLGEAPWVLGAVGADFAPYQTHLAAHGVETGAIRVLADAYTAQCFIISDVDANQITAFHPGAMDRSAECSVADLPAPPRLAIVAPSGREGTLKFADELTAAGVPFVFDPGQELPLFSRDELVSLIDAAAYVTVNDYESELLVQRAGLSLAEIACKVDALIVTRGAAGSDIYTGGERLSIPAAALEAELADPAGCGDAYRAGLLYGLAHGLSWADTGRVASLLGALVAEQSGAQNHRFDIDSLAARYRRAYGHGWPLR
ncbi:carbohydrate kinase family protein [Crenobacter cavernae]|uniref:Carbohydrate kinase family protein n=1 Tax=Crenobacter cavernae TaxID=2290923 RepID=A0ABY0FED0_9NEIS|nr:carbohydrate kinase family protein [Crenobacter cavernae]RXZ44591.1 carbohydrate kinase family protein [Crenobacter cavernae]